MARLIVLRGYPGSGKTTIGKRLHLRGVGEFIDHNAILTFIAQIAGDDEGIYDEIAQLELAICKKLLNEGKNVIVARGFSTLASMAPYEKVASDLGAEIKIIRLSVDGSELIRRVQSPERKLDFNPTVDEGHAIDWMSNNPIDPYSHELVVDNNKPIDDTISSIEVAL